MPNSTAISVPQLSKLWAICQVFDLLKLFVNCSGPEPSHSLPMARQLPKCRQWNVGRHPRLLI